MKIKSYLLAGLATFALVSCDESFNDWTEQATNTQGEAVAFGNGAVKAVDAIDFSQFDENTDSVQICEITKAPTSSDGAYTSAYTLRIPYTDKKGEAQTEILKMGSTGKVKYADFKSFVETVYSKRPRVNEISAIVRVTMSMNNTNASYLNSDEFIIKAKPDAPIIENAYYYYGATTKWSKTDKTYKLANSGADVYEDPVFTAIVPAPKNADGTAAENWFKIAPESAFTAEDFETNVIGAKADGETSREGNFVQGKDKAGAWNITDKEAKYYKIELNMLEGTYKVTPLNFEEYYYESGDNNGWQARDFLSTSTYDGKYEGFMYLKKEFKFRPSADNWDVSLDATFFGETGNNILVEKPGYYQVKLDVVNKTKELIPIKSIGVIGDATADGWASDQDMTYNETDRCWEIKDITLKDGSIKFRSNDDWGKNPNWGGKDLNHLTQGGDNLNVTAGTYDIKLYAFCNGKAYAVMTKK